MAGTAANYIKKFVIISGLLVSAISAFPLSHHNIEASFKNLDTDHDGILRLKDLSSLFDAMDTNDDDYLSHKEFTDAAPPESSRPFFNFYDKLDGTEDHRVFRIIETILFKHLDHNSDGEVPYSEFQHTFPLFYGDVMEQTKHSAP